MGKDVMVGRCAPYKGFIITETPMDELIVPETPFNPWRAMCVPPTKSAHLEYHFEDYVEETEPYLHGHSIPILWRYAT